MSESMLEKVIRTTEIGAAGGGILPPQAANRFIDYMWDATVLGRTVRTKRLRSSVAELEAVHVGRRQIRSAVEAVDTGVNAGVTFSKVSMTTSRVRLDWELSTESLEDNLEGADLEDHIARLMATQTGNDLEELAINGDTDYTGDDQAFFRIFDGWSKRLRDGATIVDAEGEGPTRNVFNKALKAMPRHFMQNRGNLRWFVGSGAIQDYLYSLQVAQEGMVNDGGAAAAALANPVRTEGPGGTVGFRIFGVDGTEVPLFNEQRTGTHSGAEGDHSEMWLTYPNNLVWAVKRDIKIYRQFAQKKDTIEFTLYARVGTAVENPAAAVVVDNLGVE